MSDNKKSPFPPGWENKQRRMQEWSMLNSQVVGAEINSEELIKTLTAERDSARRELEQLKKDKERLDWLESDEGSMQPVMCLIRKHGEAGESLTFREAIDAAMRKESE